MDDYVLIETPVYSTYVSQCLLYHINCSIVLQDNNSVFYLGNERLICFVKKHVIGMILISLVV